MGLPPWETSDSQLFVLVTGANSGLGFGIATRLIDEFLTSPSTPPNEHLVLIIVTRSPLKTRFALSRLRAHLRGLAEYSSFATKLRKKAKDQGVEYKWQTTVKRVHFLGVEVDLCDLKGVYALADKLLNGTLGTPDATTYDGLKLPAGSPGTQGYSKDIQQDRWALSEREGSSGHMRAWGWGLSGIRIPRLDVVVWNAGIGGWTGMDWPAAVWTVLTDIKEATTWPAYKIANVGAVIKSQLGLPNAANSADGDDKQPLLNDEKNTEPPLGEVFCANVFGHYTLAHELMPLLSRPASPTSKSGGKIIWVSSIEALPEQFSVDDIQGLKSEAPYESGKRLVDILALSADLPSTQNASKTFFECSNKATPEEKENGAGESVTLVKPKVYVVHPGVFASEIMPLAWILVRFMEIAFYLARWLGSPWHGIVPYKAAVAPVWLALAGEETLEQMNGTRSKWGSATDRWGEERVRKTEVGGWGWDGKVGSLQGRDDGEGVVEQRTGRHRGAINVTKEAREEFEIQGAKSWREMEVLRMQWKKLLSFEDKEK